MKISMKRPKVKFPLLDSRAEMTSQVKSRFALIVVISVLFSTALASLYQLTGNTSGDWVFWGTLVPAIYITAYVIYEIWSRHIADFILNVMRGYLLLSIGLFVFPVTIISFYKTGMVLGIGMKTLLYLSIAGIPLAAVMFLLMVILAVVMRKKMANA